MTAASRTKTAIGRTASVGHVQKSNANTDPLIPSMFHRNRLDFPSPRTALIQPLRQAIDKAASLPGCCERVRFGA